jgi:predicted metal-dependent peptidase
VIDLRRLVARRAAPPATAARRRAEPALAVLMERAPAFAGLSLWIEHADGADEADDAPLAWTDGVRIVYEPAFARLTLPEQAGVAAVQILHVAFMHCQRAAALRAVTPGADRRLIDLAADAVAAEAVAGQRWAALPPGTLLLSDLLAEKRRRAKGKDPPDLPPAHAWSMEDAARLLLSMRDDDLKSVRRAIGRRSDLAEKPGRRSEDRPAGAGVEAPDAADDRGAEAPADAADARMVWRHRLLRAAAGDRPDGVLRRLSGDIPRADTPWERVLRTWAFPALAAGARATRSRPGRRWLAISDGGRDLSVAPEPGIERTSRVPRIAVLADTSGSIPPDLLDRFGAEIAAIARRTGAEVHVFVCDAAVHEHAVLRPGEARGALGRVRFRGGGGTDFRPAFAAMEACAPSVAVCLTDMDGPAPERAPPFPVVWAFARPAAGDPPAPPFGRVLALR